MLTPTLLIDEIDTKFTNGGGNEDLRSILNAGHTRTLATVVRSERSADGAFEPRQFSVFGPKVVAGIGGIPGTVKDRSIHVLLRRKTRTDRVSRLRQDQIPDELEMERTWIAHWSQDHLSALKHADPDLPDALNDRARDNWRPLIAIADLVGGGWPERARKAALALSSQDSADDVGVLLLEDLSELFETTGRAFCPTADVLVALNARDDRPWPDWKEGTAMTSVQLARLLRPFGVRPSEHLVEDQVLRGYLRTDCQDSYARYLSP